MNDGESNFSIVIPKLKHVYKNYCDSDDEDDEEIRKIERKYLSNINYNDFDL